MLNIRKKAEGNYHAPEFVLICIPVILSEPAAKSGAGKGQAMIPAGCVKR